MVVTNEMLRAFSAKSRYDYRTAFIKWWINSRKNGGLRLTNAGFKILDKMNYNTYSFNVKQLTTTRNLITMDKNFECPYYIDGLGTESKLVMFGSKEATLINLYGDFHTFIKVYH